MHARILKYKLKSHQLDNDSPPHLQVERVCICSARRFHIEFNVWRLQILREANFPTFGSSAVTAVSCELAAFCTFQRSFFSLFCFVLFLLLILFWRKVDTQHPELWNLKNFPLTLNFSQSLSPPLLF